MNINFLCTRDWVFRDVPHQLWEATTADGTTANVWLTRLYHNKPLFYLNNFSRCYFSYLSVDFLAKSFSIIGLALFAFGVYRAIREKKYALLAFVIIAPLFPLFQFPSGNFFQGILLYSSQFLIILFGVYRLLAKAVTKLHAFKNPTS